MIPIVLICVIIGICLAATLVCTVLLNDGTLIRSQDGYYYDVMHARALAILIAIAFITWTSISYVRREISHHTTDVVTLGQYQYCDIGDNKPLNLTQLFPRCEWDDTKPITLKVAARHSCYINWLDVQVIKVSQNENASIARCQ